MLGRARKRVLVVDEARPANAVSQGVGGLLGHDRVKPADLRDSGRRQLEEHDVELRHGAVEDVERIRDGFLVTTADGPPVRAHVLALAHGLRYDPPPLPGIEALLGPVGVPLRLLRRLGGARPPAGVPRQRPRPSVHSTTSLLHLPARAPSSTAAGPLPWNASGRSRTSQPSQKAQWNTDRPQSASIPGSGGGS